MAYSPQIRLPKIFNLTSNQNVYTTEKGSLMVDALFSFSKPMNQYYDYCKVYRQDITNNGVYEYIGDARGNIYIQKDLFLNTEYTFAFCTVNKDKVEMPIGLAPYISITTGSVGTYIDLPVAPTTISVLPYEDGVGFNWEKPSSNIVKGYNVRDSVAGGSWSDWLFIGNNTYSRDLTTTEIVAQGKGNSSIDFNLKTVDIFDQLSVTITAGGLCLNQKPYITVSDTNEKGSFTSIQDAIDAIEAVGGGSIFIKNGTYQLSSPVTITDVPLDMTGESQDGVIIRNLSGSNGFVLWDNTKTFVFSTFTVENTNTISVGTKLFYIYGATSTKRANVTFDHVTLKGTAITNINTLDYPIYATAYDPFYTGGGSIRVLNCDIEKGNTGCYIQFYSFVQVEGVVFKENYRSALVSTVEKVAFVDNTLVDVTAYGAYLGNSENATISGNFININADSSLVDTERIGLNIIGSNINCEGNIVQISKTDADNIVYAGIYGNFAGATHILNNRVNIIINSSTFMYGAYITGITDGEIANNTFYLDNNDVTTNRYGIILTGNASRNVVQGNNIDMVNNNAKDIGIRLDSGSNNNQGGDNITYNVGTSISNAGTGNVVTAKDV